MLPLRTESGEGLYLILGSERPGLPAAFRPLGVTERIGHGEVDHVGRLIAPGFERGRHVEYPHVVMVGDTHLGGPLVGDQPPQRFVDRQLTGSQFADQVEVQQKVPQCGVRVRAVGHQPLHLRARLGVVVVILLHRVEHQAGHRSGVVGVLHGSHRAGFVCTGVGAGEPCAGCADAVLVALVLLGVDLAAEAALGCAVGGAAAVLAPPVAARGVCHRCPWRGRGDRTGDVTRLVLRIGCA